MESPLAKRWKINSIYPTLPSEDLPESPEWQAHSYRLQQISLLKWQLESERDKRASLYTRYHTAVNVIDGADSTLVATSLAMGIAGWGLLLTIIAAPIVLGLEIGSVACKATGLVGKPINRKLEIISKKHNEIRLLAEAKLNTISSYISTTIADGNIDDVIYKLILDEMIKFGDMKNNIQ